MNTIYFDRDGKITKSNDVPPRYTISEFKNNEFEIRLYLMGVYKLEPGQPVETATPYCIVANQCLTTDHEGFALKKPITVRCYDYEGTYRNLEDAKRAYEHALKELKLGKVVGETFVEVGNKLSPDAPQSDRVDAGDW